MTVIGGYREPDYGQQELEVQEKGLEIGFASAASPDGGKGNPGFERQRELAVGPEGPGELTTFYIFTESKKFGLKIKGKRVRTAPYPNNSLDTTIEAAPSDIRTVEWSDDLPSARVMLVPQKEFVMIVWEIEQQLHNKTVTIHVLNHIDNKKNNNSELFVNELNVPSSERFPYASKITDPSDIVVQDNITYNKIDDDVYKIDNSSLNDVPPISGGPINKL
jgi:hypothetical protein